MRFGQAADPPGGRGERDPVPGLGGGDRQCGRQVGFTGAGRTEQDDVAGFGQPAAAFEAGDLGPVRPGWAVKSKSVIVLIAGNPAYRMRWRAPDSARALDSTANTAAR